MVFPAEIGYPYGYRVIFLMFNVIKQVIWEEDGHVDSQGFGMVGSVVSFFYWGSTLHGGGSCRDKSL